MHNSKELNPIVRWRLIKSKTQQDIADATDSSNSAVRDWEKGRVFPTWAKIEMLATLMSRDAAGLEGALRRWNQQQRRAVTL